jgi:hypothetical protein
VAVDNWFKSIMTIVLVSRIHLTSWYSSHPTSTTAITAMAEKAPFTVFSDPTPELQVSCTSSALSYTAGWTVEHEAENSDSKSQHASTHHSKHCSRSREDVRNFSNEEKENFIFDTSAEKYLYFPTCDSLPDGKSFKKRNLDDCSVADILSTKMLGMSLEEGLSRKGCNLESRVMEPEPVASGSNVPLPSANQSFGDVAAFDDPRAASISQAWWEMPDVFVDQSRALLWGDLDQGMKSLGEEQDFGKLFDVVEVRFAYMPLK